MDTIRGCAPTLRPCRTGLAINLLVFLLGIIPAGAQLPTATILGVVKDQSGSVIPGVSLTSRSVETGQVRTTISADDGSYRLSALPVGSYEIQAEHSGFLTETRTGLALAVAQEAVVNFTLQIGSVQQRVEVTAEAPLVNTTSGALGGLVSEQKVQELPLNGRNFVSLTFLQTGVAQIYNNNNSVNAGVAALGGTWFSSSGAPVRSNTYLLDGANMGNIFGGSVTSVTNTSLGLDGIREYKVITNSFGAEYGMSMGSQMTIVSKGGTNSFHGSLFEYLRNDALDAKNYFDTPQSSGGKRLPPFRRNNFGGAFGGPIKKDHTFVQVVYEELRERLGLTQVDNVIPPAARVDGGAVPTINPVMKAFIALYPLPNLPNNQYSFPANVPTDEHYGQARVDQNLGGNDSLFARYTIDNTVRTQPLNFPQINRALSSRSQFTTLSETHVFSPALVNTARFSQGRTVIKINTDSGIIGPQYSLVPGRELGAITIPGITTFGPSTDSRVNGTQDIYTFSDDIFYTRGRHSLKFGALINHYNQYLLYDTFANGYVVFPSLNAYLLAQPTQYVLLPAGSAPVQNYTYNTVGFYVQDDLRLTPRLTINAGLRYEFLTQLQEIHNHASSLQNLVTDANVTTGSKPFLNPSLRNFSPRLGFAWDVKGDGRTAIRGGFVLLYDIGNIGSALIYTSTGRPPFASQTTVLNPPTITVPLSPPPQLIGTTIRQFKYDIQQPHMFQYNLTAERQLPFGTALSLGYVGSRGMNLYRFEEGNPTVGYQVLPNSQPFWTGTESRANPNWSSIQLVNADGDSWYNSFQLGVNKRVSHGLQFQSSYTWSRTIDDAQGLASADSGSAVAIFPADPAYSRGLAAFAVEHLWRFNASYHLPDFSKAGVLSKITNGWWVSGIWSMQTGFPFTPMLTTNRSRSQNVAITAPQDRPNIVPGRDNDNITHGGSTGCGKIPAGTQLGTPSLWFDPCAFAIQPAGFLGNEPRDIVIGPGLRNLDFSIVKDTAVAILGEGGRVEFRAETFNLLNHANFSLPAASVYAGKNNVENPIASAGQITSTATTSRQIQFGLRVMF